MKTNDLDLGQKVKFLHFLILNNNSTGGKFFLYMKSGFKVKRRRKKSVKSRGKNFKKNLFMHFYTESWNATNKSSLFDAKFFEFEEFSIEPFFLGSI